MNNPNHLILIGTLFVISLVLAAFWLAGDLNAPQQAENKSEQTQPVP